MCKNPIAREELDKNATSWGRIPTDSDLVDVSGAWECVFHTQRPMQHESRGSAGAPRKSVPSGTAPSLRLGLLHSRAWSCVCWGPCPERTPLAPVETPGRALGLSVEWATRPDNGFPAGCPVETPGSFENSDVWTFPWRFWLRVSDFLRWFKGAARIEDH